MTTDQLDQNDARPGPDAGTLLVPQPRLALELLDDAVQNSLDIVAEALRQGIPAGWSTAQRIALERFALAGVDALAAFYPDTFTPESEASMRGWIYLPARDDAGNPRCGAPTRTTGHPCRSTVLAPGERCDHHADGDGVTTG